MDIKGHIKDIANLPYFERRIHLSKISGEKFSRFLYKYRAVKSDDLEAIDKLRDILVRSRAWLSSPADFNDPFDMTARFELSTSAIAKRKRFYSLAKQQGLKRKAREKYITQMMRVPHKTLENSLTHQFKKSIAKTGVFSFAGDPRNILMWSHYAKDHTGICIQFEVARDFSRLSHAHPVHYSSEYPEINWVNGFSKSISELILNKHEGWSYEKEERISLPEKANQYFMFNPNAITGIIFGCKATSNEKNTVLNLLKERTSSGRNPIKLFQAVQHKHQYCLKICSHEES